MRKLTLVPLVLMLGVVGCKKEEEAAARAPSSVLAEPAAATKADVAARQTAGPTASRKLILTGSVTLEVDDVAEARRRVDEVTRELGGHLARLDSDVDGGGARATLTVRVPTARYDEALARLANLGRVVRESANAQDITEEYTDLAARLANQRALEARILELMARKENTLQELLGLEAELTRVREQIELHEGRIRLYDDQVSLSTLTVELAGKGRIAAVVTRSGEPSVSGTLAGSVRALRALGRGLLILLVALLPWSPLIAGAAYGIKRLVRWHRLASR